MLDQDLSQSTNWTACTDAFAAYDTERGISGPSSEASKALCMVWETEKQKCRAQLRGYAIS